MFSIIIILFLVYFPISLPSPPTADHEHHHEHHHSITRPLEALHSEYRPPSYRTAVSVTLASTAFFIIGAIISITLIANDPHKARVWAAWLGVGSMILAAAQYIPQLWVTWRIEVPSSFKLADIVSELLPYPFR